MLSGFYKLRCTICFICLKFFKSSNARVILAIGDLNARVFYDKFTNQHQIKVFYISDECYIEFNTCYFILYLFQSRTHTFKKIFAKLKFSPALFEKTPSFVCLVFKIENK